MKEVQLLCYYPNLDRTTFLWNLFFIFGLDPLTHICTLEKGESDSTLKFKILQLFCVSCDYLTSVFGWVNKTQFSYGITPSVLNVSLKEGLWINMAS